jgi:hypothetical protein
LKDQGIICCQSLFLPFCDSPISSKSFCFW